MANDFDPVYEAVLDAKGVAFDGCHKIYVLMDDKQVEQTRSYGYGTDEGSFLLTKPEVSEGEMFETVKDWFEGSCGLRFIDAVSTDPEADGEIFTSLIGQFELDECEDCGERGCAGVCSDNDEEEDEEEDE